MHKGLLTPPRRMALCAQDRQTRRAPPPLELQGQGAQRSMVGLGAQPFGTGLQSPIAASLVAHLEQPNHAPRSLRWGFAADVATVAVALTGPRLLKECRYCTRRLRNIVGAEHAADYRQIVRTGCDQWRGVGGGNSTDCAEPLMRIGGARLF